jgi:hypothetical protein
MSFTAEVTPTSVVGNGFSVTMTFPVEDFIPFIIGSKISVTGFLPTLFNGTYTVTGATTGSVTFTNSTNTVNFPVTQFGTVTLLTVPYPIGSKISVTGFEPVGYNGIFTVTNASTSSVSFVNTTTAPVTTYGAVALTVYYQLIAGSLPSGMQIDETGIITGIPTANASLQGVPSNVLFDTASKFAIRAYTQIGITKQLADRTFVIEVANTSVPAFVTSPGQITQLYDATLVTDLQIQYTGPESTVVRLASGSLPPGLSISPTGLISGLISLSNLNISYQFTLELSDGKSTNTGTILRSFSIYVWSRNSLSADDTYITADNTFITADGTPIIIPVLLNPEGSIGTVRSDNFFAYHFEGIDLSGESFNYLIDTNLPGLTLDPNSGWLYGNIPPLGINSRTFSFNIYLQLVDYPDYLSPPYSYSLTVVGPVNADITWLTPSDLGSIDNGATSTLYIEAVNTSGIPLQYQLLSGSDSLLPQGLQLFSTGEIAGRVSFNTFALDMGDTTFDNNTTTFDLVFTFTVNAYSQNGLISSNQTFSIRVNRAYNEPYDNLYIQAMPTLNDRVIINGLLQNSDIFQQDLLYRPTDPNFGVAKNVTYYHAYGLTAATYDDYVRSLDINHYWKNLVLGEIDVAQAINSAGEVIYEVVYSRIIDDLVNAEGESVSKNIKLPYKVEIAGQSVSTVYPNSLINMRDQVIDTVGQISNTLPLWMICKQANGQTLGFTPAWVIAYCKPGRGQQLAYYIGQDFVGHLNTIDFEVDRYELDNLLTKNWNREEQHWIPKPPTVTTFDYGSANFNIDPWISQPIEYYAVSRISGNGSQATVTFFPTQSTVPFTPGQVVNISGVVPDVYNGTVTVTSCTRYGFMFASSSTVKTGRTGIVRTVSDVVEWNNVDNDTVQWTNDYNGEPTTFDGGSLQFIAPVDMYSNTNEYDKYLVFPRRNILE